MGVVTFEKEVTSAVPASKMFKVFVLESATLIPKIIPGITVETLEGDGGPGTVIKTTFPNDSDAKYIKTKIEAIDKDNLAYSYSIIGGEPWLPELEKVTYDTKIEASADGGSICKSLSKHYPKEGCTLDEEKIKAGGEKAFALYKAIESHLLANPDFCN